MNDLNIYLDFYVVVIGTNDLTFESKNIRYKLKGPFLNTFHNDVLTIRSEYFSATAHTIADQREMFNFIIRAMGIPIDYGYIHHRSTNPYTQFETIK